MDCFISGGTEPGLVFDTRTSSGYYLSGGPDGYGIGNISDATLYNGVGLDSSFAEAGQASGDGGRSGLHFPNKGLAKGNHFIYTTCDCLFISNILWG